MRTSVMHPWRVSALAAVVAALALAAAFVSPGGAAGPGEKGGGHKGGGYEAPTAIYSGPVGGGGATKLTQGSGYTEHSDFAAHAGPGGRIVFASTAAAGDGSTDSEIYLRDADGNVTQLTDSSANETNPELSPDGEWVAYDDGGKAAKEEGGCGDETEDEGCSGHEMEAGATAPAATSHVWVMNVGDRRATDVTPDADAAAADPTWSPDGKRVAYSLGTSRDSHIESVALTFGEDGTVATGERKDITIAGYHHTKPAFDPGDENLVAFMRGEGTRADIWTVDLGDSPPTYRLLTPTEDVGEANPAWSADGTLIAFQRGGAATGDAIWVMSTDGSDQRAVTTPDGWTDRNPSFAEDGSVVFESTRDARPAADLSIVAAGEPASAEVGGTVTFDVSVASFGPATAHDVTVTLKLGEGLSFVSGTAKVPTADGTSELELEAVDGAVTLAVDELVPTGGEPGPTLQVVASAARAGTWTTTATVSLADLPGQYDPAASDNTASATTTVTDAPAPPGEGGATPPESDEGSAGSAASDEAGSGGGSPAGGGTAGGGGAKAPQTAGPREPQGLQAGKAPVTVGPFEATIVGTAGDDVLIGTPGDDVIVAGDGNDRIAGLGGDDIVVGGPGDDVLYGGPGNDVLNGGAGNDRLSGKQGNDVVYGGTGDDRIGSRTGGSDRHYGGAGDDRFVADDGVRDWINGGRGADSAVLDRGLDGTYGVESIR